MIPPFVSRLHYGWIVLAMGTLVVFGALGLSRHSYAMVLPAMQVGLGMGNTQAGVLATANMTGYLALVVIGGAMASRYGPRVVITVGLALAGIGMLFTGLSNSFVSAAGWRGLTGLGSAASNVPIMGLMSYWFVTQRRGLATGVAVSGSSLGLIFVGSLAPYLLSTYGENGWRVCWLIFGGLTVLLAVASYIILRNRPAEKGLEPVGKRISDPPLSQKPEPLQLGRVYRNGTVWHLGLVYIAFGFSYVIFMTFFSKYLIVRGGYTPEAAGRLFMIMGWFSLICGLLWGTVSDKIGRKRALIIVYLTHAVAFSLFSLWPSPPGFTISAILFGQSAWSIPAIMAAACGDVLGPRLASAALGFITLFYGIGQAMGPSIAGAIADSTGSFFLVFLLAGGVAFLGAVGASLLRPVSRTSPQAGAAVPDKARTANP